MEQKSAAGYSYQASYTYISDKRFKHVGILNLPYFEDNSFNDKELKEILLRLTGAYLTFDAFGHWSCLFYFQIYY